VLSGAPLLGSIEVVRAVLSVSIIFYYFCTYLEQLHFFSGDSTVNVQFIWFFFVAYAIFQILQS
jgi:hypothetical protein